MDVVELVESLVDGGSLDTDSCGSEDVVTGCGLLKGCFASDCKAAKGRFAAARDDRLEGPCVFDCEIGAELTDVCCVCDCEAGTDLTGVCGRSGTVLTIG